MWAAVEATARRTGSGFYGFREVRTPLFEQAELFVRGVGEATDIVEKEMYTFHDRGAHLALRPEGTASVVRAFLEHGLHTGRAGQAVVHRAEVPLRAPAEGALSAVPPGRRRVLGDPRPAPTPR